MGFEVLAHPPHGGNTIAEAGGNFARAFALVVKVKYPLTHRNRNGFHANTLPPLQRRGKLHNLCKRSAYEPGQNSVGLSKVVRNLSGENGFSGGFLSG
jgi:hypothetical protein